MLLKRTGMPEEGDLLLCTVSKIYYNSVFVNLDEFPGKSGMIHISEIAPGRIRNIRDYVVEGKKVVCKVLRIDIEKGYIDLSLRRVTEGQKREKIDEIKQEQKAEKIVEHLSKELKKDLNDVYTQLSEKLLDTYPTLFNAFQAVAFGEIKLEDSISKDIAKPLSDLIMQRIKPPKVEISGSLAVKTYAPNGITLIKQAFEKALKKTKDQVTVSYLGAGKYYFIVTAPDYKEAEVLMKDIIDAITKELKKIATSIEFVRKEK